MLQAKEEVLACKHDKVTVATVEPKVAVYRSKTFLALLINWLAVKYLPGFADWIAKNPEAYAEMIGIVLIILRNFTAGKIKWKFWQKQITIKED